MSIVSDCIDQFATASGACWYVPANLSGLYQDAEGLIPVTGVGQRVGALVDACKPLNGSRRNLLDYSEQLNNGVWVKTRSTIVADAYTDPVIGLVADKLVEDSTALNGHFVHQSEPFIAGTTYTYSCYAKAGGRNFLRLSLNLNAFGSLQLAYFNLLTGTIVSTTSSAEIELIGNGWYRVSLTATAVATQTDNAHIALSPDGSSITYTGNGTSGVYLTQMQLEASPSATPYQLTTSSWLSASGGKHCTQAAAASRPTLRMSASGVPALEFDGIDDFLPSTLSYTSGDTFSMSVAGFGTVASKTAIGSTNEPAVANSRMSLGTNAAGEASGVCGATSSTALTASTSAATAFVMTLVRNATSLKLYLNGVLVKSPTGTSGIPSQAFYLGALNAAGVPSEFWTGQVVFAGVARAAFTDAQRLLVERFAGALVGKAIYSPVLLSFPSICPTSATPPLSLSPTLISESQSLKRQVRSALVQRWSVELGWDNIEYSLYGVLSSFLAQCRGRYAVVELPLFGKFGTNIGGQTANLAATEAVAVGAAYCKASGFNVSGVVMQAGSFFRFAGHSKLYQCVADVEAYGGVATIDFYPQAYKAVAVGEGVQVNAVTMRAALQSDNLDGQMQPAYLMSLKATFVEVLP